jgi:hypothetical protein
MSDYEWLVGMSIFSLVLVCGLVVCLIVVARARRRNRLK